MHKVQIREAKAGLSKLVEAAERGEATTITRHGKPVAMLVPVERGRQLYPETKKSLIDHLLTFPGGVEFERDRESTLRPVDLD